MSFHDRVINVNNSAPGPGAVVEWRAERLIEAGVPSEVARRVAADRAYDLHAVLVLVDRGCPAELALRILAPLDQDDVRC